MVSFRACSNPVGRAKPSIMQDEIGHHVLRRVGFGSKTHTVRRAPLQSAEAHTAKVRKIRNRQGKIKRKTKRPGSELQHLTGCPTSTLDVRGTVQNLASGHICLGYRRKSADRLAGI